MEYRRLDEITFKIKDIISILIALVAVVGCYWKLKLMVNEKLDKKDFTVYQAEIQKEINDGMKEITEVYHGLDKKQSEIEIRLRSIEEKE